MTAPDDALAPPPPAPSPALPDAASTPAPVRDEEVAAAHSYVDARPSHAAEKTA